VCVCVCVCVFEHDSGVGWINPRVKPGISASKKLKSESLGYIDGQQQQQQQNKYLESYSDRITFTNDFQWLTRDMT
jgi:hypothetical protein